MLKYIKRFADVKTISTFETSITQMRYTNATIDIHKKHYITLKHFTQWKH
jgi:hypothetical protein